MDRRLWTEDRGPKTGDRGPETPSKIAVVKKAVFLEDGVRNGQQTSDRARVSDGSTSFTALGDFLVKQGVYTDADVYYLDYSSMDDEATFHDFADKLDADYRLRLNGQRVDVICHSTGSLVVRAWLALHAERNRRRKLDEDCPVDRLVCFAPANFGSDLAGLGQSFLGKFRTTFFNSNSHKEDFLESGKVVLRRAGAGEPVPVGVVLQLRPPW